MPSKNQNLNIRILQYFQFLNFGYVLAIPVLIDYFDFHLSNGSETYFYLSSIMNVFAIMIALFVGAYSDLYSRRTMLYINSVCKTLCWLIFWLFPSHYMFLTALILFATGSLACNTSVCLYETLEASQRGEDYRRLEQTLTSYPQLILMIALPISGLLYEYNRETPFILNALISIFGLLILSFYTEPERHKSKERSVMRFLNNIFKFIHKRGDVKWFICYAAVMNGVTFIIIFVFQAAFFEVGGSVSEFSLALVGIYLCRALGATQAARFFDFAKHPVRVLLYCLVLSSLAIIASGIGQQMIGMTTFSICMFLYMFFRGIQTPTINYVYNELVRSDKRATVYNGITLVMRGWMIALNFGLGFGIATLGAGATLLYMGLASLLIGLGLLLLVKRNWAG